MKKKIKDLTMEEMLSFCHKYYYEDEAAGFYSCSNKCPMKLENRKCKLRDLPSNMYEDEEVEVE